MCAQENFQQRVIDVLIEYLGPISTPYTATMDTSVEADDESVVSCEALMGDVADNEGEGIGEDERSQVAIASEIATKALVKPPSPPPHIPSDIHDMARRVSKPSHWYSMSFLSLCADIQSVGCLNMVLQGDHVAIKALPEFEHSRIDEEDEVNAFCEFNCFAKNDNVRALLCRV